MNGPGGGLNIRNTQRDTHHFAAKSESFSQQKQLRVEIAGGVEAAWKTRSVVLLVPDDKMPFVVWFHFYLGCDCCH